MTPTVEPGATKFAAQPVDERALAGAGRTGHADQEGAPGVREQRPDQIGGARIVVFDEGDGPRDRARLPGQHAVGERGRHESSCRAMTSRWISLVPSPMVVSFTSRKNFSAG